MKKTYLLTLAAALCAASANAAIVAYDGFVTGTDPSAGEYTVGTSVLGGQNPTVTGWTGQWNLGTGNGNILSAGLNYTGLTTTGGAVQSEGNARFGRDLTTAFSNSTSGTFYMSVLIQVTAVNTSYRSFELHNGGLSDENRTLQIAVGEGATGSNFALRINNDDTKKIDLGANDTAVNLFVMKFDFSTSSNSDTVTLWRNPEDLTSESGSTIDANLTGFDMQFNITSLARFSSGGVILMDELKIGQTWADVAAVPEPSTFALLGGFVALGICLVRRRRLS
jgi:hypothetical protein